MDIFGHTVFLSVGRSSLSENVLGADLTDTPKASRGRTRPGYECEVFSTWENKLEDRPYETHVMTLKILAHGHGGEVYSCATTMKTSVGLDRADSISRVLMLATPWP